MAALCPGVHYGLSSQQNYGENRDLIFVKLTDSALRAIEEYLKNQNKFNNHKPTIKFLGNENGELSFPSMHHQTGQTSFNFSISSTADMEGQGGSFECIKQAGPPKGPLEGLGSIPHKLRIHANDDVYEVTRNRMTEAEDKYKNKCTREIKPNQTDIGRKVKVKQTARAPLHPVHHHHHHHRKEMPSMRDSLLKQPQPSAYQPNPKPAQVTQPHAVVHSSTSNNGPPLGSHHVGSTRSKIEVGKKSSEMPRRPINRKPPPPPHILTPPGGSDGGSSGSGQSPNSTHPGSPPPAPVTSTKRPGFHEGPDGFAYKRQRIAHNAQKPADQPPYQPPFEGNGQRRPPTDSRDASNMNPRSRESPVSAGYPFPNGYQQPSSGYQQPSNGYQQPSNGYQQPSNGYQQPSNGYQQPSNGYQQPSNGYQQPSNGFQQPSNGYQQPSNGYQQPSNGYQQPSNGYQPLSNGYQPPSHDKQRHSSEDEEDKKQAAPPVAVSSQPYEGVDVVKLEPPEIKRERSAEREAERQQKAAAAAAATAERQNGYAMSGRQLNGRVRQPPIEREAERAAKYNKVSSSTDNRIARVSPDSQTDGMPVPEPDPMPYPGSDADFVEKENEFPDYRKQYVTIRDPEQRRKYKVDFNADYAEYRDLHAVVEKVSRKFALLEERLKQENVNSTRYKDIRRQIVCEYQESKKDTEHLRAKRRFQYLHDKLSHIKKLVADYDQHMADCRY